MLAFAERRSLPSQSWSVGEKRHPLCVLLSFAFGFLSHVDQLGRQRKTPEAINVHRREALV